MNVLGIDCGFSSLGWAVASVEDGAIRPLLCGVIRTEKQTKKTNTRSSEDNIRRAGELFDALSNIINQHNVRIICAETMSWPRNAGVVAKMGIAWGVIASVSFRYSVPITQASPMILKKAITGNGKSSKEEMIAKVREMFPQLELPNQSVLQEHAVDAVAAIIACEDSELMRFANAF